MIRHDLRDKAAKTADNVVVLDRKDPVTPLAEMPDLLMPHRLQGWHMEYRVLNTGRLKQTRCLDGPFRASARCDDSRSLAVPQAIGPPNLEDIFLRIEQ